MAEIKYHCFLVFACIWVVGGQSLKMAKPFLGVELAVRCERSEHGESQLSIKYLCTIYSYCFKVNFNFLHVVKCRLQKYSRTAHCRPRISHNVVAASRGRGLTKDWAGGTLANSHKCFCGHTPPLS